jgi:hypothetical protein
MLILTLIGNESATVDPEDSFSGSGEIDRRPASDRGVRWLGAQKTG